MREILFRGKRIDNSEWVHGGFYRGVMPETENPFSLDNARIKTIIIQEGTYYHVDPSTVGQFTGLKDKNGKRIFEGDIVKVHDTYKQYSEPNHEFTGVVEFDNASFLINQDDCVKHYRWMDYECEVIGNIHDEVKP